MKGREGEVEGRKREGPQVNVEPGPLRALLRHCQCPSVAWIRRKYGGQDQSGQALKLFQAPRKISFNFCFDISLSSWMT